MSRYLFVGKSEDELDEISRVHHLPVDTLQLREVDESHREYGVYTAAPLVEGSTFGPYSARLTSDPAQQNDWIAKVGCNLGSCDNVQVCIT